VRNLQTRVPKSAQSLVATLVRSIFAQPDTASVLEQHQRVCDQLAERFPAAAEMLQDAAGDLLAFTATPKQHWRQMWSNNPLERLNREIRRRTDVVGIFPDRASITRLVGAVLAEQNDEWAVARRYMSAESITKTITPPGVAAGPDMGGEFATALRPPPTIPWCAERRVGVGCEADARPARR
jgi:putative transposase